MASRRLLLTLLAIVFAFAASPPSALSSEPKRTDVLETMRAASGFMVDHVAVNGGYVWSYLPDFSRRWGEMEATPSMVWTQAPGTPQMGQVFLDAYHATGDEYYYDAAALAADALIQGQHESGGWNYVIDFAGEDALRKWYETVGRNGWRLEEFQHYYGNATFDDHATIESARLLLRIYLEKKESRFREAFDKALGFVIESQYPSGGWPQRYPPAPRFENHGLPDYTGHVTLNDEVSEQNIDFLLLVMQQLGDESVREPIQRAMDLYLETQQPPPTPGWALQYTIDLKPAGARTYEPLAMTPHTTASALTKLMDFYELTGDRKYLAPIPEVIDWLETVEAPAEAHTADGRNYFRYVEIGTNRFMAVHRRGSNAQNGEYYVDYDMTDQRAAKRIDTDALRRRHDKLSATTPEEVTEESAWFGRGPSLLPEFVVTRDIVGSDTNVRAEDGRAASAARARALIAALNEEGYWPTELRTLSHPYRGPGPSEPPEGFVDRRQVGDEWDTSPFTLESGPLGISTGTFIRNMSLLIAYLDAETSWYVQGEFEPTQRVEVLIRNPLDQERRNSPVVITRDQLSALPDVHEFAITLVDPSLPGRPQPSDDLFRRQGGHEARKETNGAWIPYQLDDLDQDGLWDELFFMSDLAPGETKVLYLYIGFQNQGWSTHRTHGGIGSYVRHTVPFWESENIGWKLWFPTDIDVFGKRRPVLMSQRLYMDNLDGYGVSTVDPDFGSDIMQVGHSFGGGGVGVFEDSANPDVVSRPRFTELYSGNNFNVGPRADSRYAFEVLANGPVRSVVRARTFNWNSGNGAYEVEQIYTAYAGESYATSRVHFPVFEPTHGDTTFAVGMRKHVGETSFHNDDGIIISGAPEAIRNQDDEGLRPNSLVVDFVGSALVVRNTFSPDYVFVPAFDGNHVFRIEPNEERRFEYLIAAGWSEGAVNNTAMEFENYVLRVAEEYNAPVEFVGAKIEERGGN